jgi:hypothetical protein
MVRHQKTKWEMNYNPVASCSGSDCLAWERTVAIYHSSRHMKTFIEHITHAAMMIRRFPKAAGAVSPLMQAWPKVQFKHYN